MATAPPFAATRALAELLERIAPAAAPSGPPPSLESLKQRREDILRLANGYGASDVRVVGSVARATASVTSDVDFLVRFPSSARLTDLALLQAELESLLGCSVDVIPEFAGPPPTGESPREMGLRERLSVDAVAL
ncbi:MAG: nucleotidyltransferase domain-containing protein [Thermoleophilia bacterium]|nr:nucleotidyltransferase domain-containing protein [Thermoleophilia bacterium]